MDVMKFQAEIVKNPAIWKWDYDKEEEIVYFSDSAMIRQIPVRECLLDLSKFEQTDCIKWFQDEGDWPEVKPTKLRLKETGYTAIQLEGEGYKCWINEGYYKIFKKYQLEYNGGDYVKVRHPSTLEIVAVIGKMKVSTTV